MTGHAPHRDHGLDAQSTVFWYLFTFNEMVAHEETKRDGCQYTYPHQHQFHELNNALDRLFNLHMQRDILDMRDDFCIHD